MYHGRRVTAVILAGGSGTRFGSRTNKVYIEALGKPIFCYSLDVFTAHEAVDELILVVKAGEEERMSQFPCGKPRKIVVGGNTRSESVYQGLMAASGEIVLIHDGARPLVQKRFIDDCLKAMEQWPGATVAVPSKDTIKLADENGMVQMTTRRANTWLVQTPQCFDRKILLEGHERHRRDSSITDDCMILEADGFPVKLVEGDYTNIKITTPSDLAMAEEYLRDLKPEKR